MTLLMGPSGSGKSTLLAILSGLLRPDSGTVLALGQDLWAMTDAGTRAFPFEALWVHLSGLQSVRRPDGPAATGDGGALGRRGFRPRRPGSGPTTCWRCCDLSKQAHLRPSELSGGEKQRVAIGRALIKKKPQFCFADEPTSALDWAHGQQVVELLRNAAHDRGAAVLCVAHDDRIGDYADRIFNLRDGRLDDPDEEPAGHEAPGRVPTHNYQ